MTIEAVRQYMDRRLDDELVKLLGRVNEGKISVAKARIRWAQIVLSIVYGFHLRRKLVYTEIKSYYIDTNTSIELLQMSFEIFRHELGMSKRDAFNLLGYKNLNENGIINQSESKRIYNNEIINAKYKFIKTQIKRLPF